MAITYHNLLITGVNGALNSPVPTNRDTQLYVNENTPADRVIGKIHGFAAGEQLDQLIFNPQFANGEPGDAGGRYAIVRATAEMVAGSTEFAVGDWVVVLKAGVVADNLRIKILQDHVKATIAPYKYPRVVKFVDALPKTQTGKIQRFKLREQAS